MKKTILTIIGIAALSAPAGFGQVVINNLNVAFTENFNGMGSSATATLPAGFRVNSAANWDTGVSATTLAAGTTGTGALNGTSSGGYYNFADGITASSTDRALGILNTGSFTSPRSVVFAFTNSTGFTINTLNVAWDYEKYRSGSRAWDWTFFHGSTATNVNTAAATGNQSYAADAANTTIFNPPTAVGKTASITGLSIANGSTYYLAWTLTGVGGSTNGQALAIDNFSLTAIPEPGTFLLLGIGAAAILIRRKLAKV